MGISVTFPETKVIEPSTGTARLKTRIGGMATTVSALMQAGKATDNPSLIRKSIV